MHKSSPMIVIATICLAVTAMMLGCGDDKPTSIQAVPAAATNLGGQTMSSSTILLYWVDNSDNETAFVIYRGQADTWSQVGVALANQITHTDSSLQDSTTYYYSVSAVNGFGNSPSSDTISITTPAWGSAPGTPRDPSPADGAIDQMTDVQLTWYCSDPDYNDDLTFDIYLGTSSPPPFADSDYTSPTSWPRSYDPGQLQEDTTYYWNIVAKDEHRHETAGPIWSFSTSHAIDSIPAVDSIGSYALPGYTDDVFVDGNYAYMTNSWISLMIINVADPANPSFAGGFTTPGSAKDVYVAGNYAYVTSYESYGWSSLQIIDVANPASPTLAGSYDSLRYANAVFVSGNHAYVADGPYDYGLRIINIANPANPTLAGIYDTPGDAYDVYVAGNYAYVADDTYGLQIIDITDPSAPTLVGFYAVPGSARKVFVADNYAFVADQISGFLMIINVANPVSPSFAGIYDTPGSAYVVFVAGNYAYVAYYGGYGGDSGLQIIDITDPSSPTLAGSYDTPDEARGVFVVGNYVYVADRQSGLLILEFVP